jgi:hypothetical protein
MGHSLQGRPGGKSGHFGYAPKAEVNSERFRNRPLRVDGATADVIQASKPEPQIMRYEFSDDERTAIEPMLPNKPRGVRRVDDRRVLDGIVWVLRSGAAMARPAGDLPRTTCYNRFVRWMLDLSR